MEGSHSLSLKGPIQALKSALMMALDVVNLAAIRLEYIFLLHHFALQLSC